MIRNTVQTMKAIVQTEYGSADVLRVEEVDRPVLTADKVLVRVRAASAHAGDWHLMRGEPLLVRLMFGGVRKPKIKTLGCDIAGEVEAVGDHVTQFQPGDLVFGDLSEFGFGAFAEYVCVPESAIVPKPENLTLEEAATVPVSALAALQGLRDVGKVQARQKVLIYGAAGGVGSYAVQIAKNLGAEVTAVCSAKKADFVRRLGIDRVVDHDAAIDRDYYDVIFNAAAYRPISEYLPALKPGGIYVLIGGKMVQFLQTMLLGGWFSKRSGRIVTSLSTKPNAKDLMVLKELIESGKLHPCIDRTYTLHEVPDAIRAIEGREVCGKVSIKI